MRFFSPFARARGSFRLLREGVRVLTRIADGIDRHNDLLALVYTDAARRLTAPDGPAGDPVASAIDYSDPAYVAAAEAVRARIYHATGQALDDEALAAYLDAHTGVAEELEDLVAAYHRRQAPASGRS